LANTASAKKRIRSSAKKRDRNRHYRSAARTYIKKTHRLIESGKLEAADEMAQKAVITLDKAARKGVVHQRNADRRKSRLMQALARAHKEAA
jgi:small subunit ribosomal protein S20